MNIKYDGECEIKRDNLNQPYVDCSGASETVKAKYTGDNAGCKNYHCCSRGFNMDDLTSYESDGQAAG